MTEHHDLDRLCVANLVNFHLPSQESPAHNMATQRLSDWCFMPKGIKTKD